MAPSTLWVLSGDFNMVVANSDRSTGVARVGARELVAFSDMLSVVRVEDVAVTCALCHGFGDAMTTAARLRQ